MKTRLIVTVIVWTAAATPAHAHRLDEYLQAMTVSVEPGRLALQLRMTPGVAVAPRLLASIDLDGDGTIADAEQRAYTQQVDQDLVAVLDGKPLRPRLVSTSFPQAADLKQGLASILLGFEVDLPPGGSSRRFILKNHHQSAIAIYLVNCLRPIDPVIRIVAQDRNENQSTYQLDFTRDDATVTQRTSPTWSDHSATLALLTTYCRYGIRHILTGADHLLFIGVLVLGATSFWELVKVVTAFTLAHSMTLTLAALDLVHLPGTVVEPVIAASIVFVAVQNLGWPASSGGRGRLAVAFLFGLFHGMGFAGGLLEIMRDLPREMIVLALLGFCVGVEAGHQLVLLPLFGCLEAIRRVSHTATDRVALVMRLRRVGSAGVLIAGIYYVFVALIGVF